MGSRRTLAAPDARERRGGEDQFYGHLEIFGDLEREIEARTVLAPLQVAYPLIVDPERLGELAPRDAPLCAQHRYAVVDGLALHPPRCKARKSSVSSLSCRLSVL